MTKSIAADERKILDLEVPTIKKKKKNVSGLGESVRFYKIGLELFMSGHYFDLLAWLTAQQKKVFVDLKFFDVPATVASAVRNLSGRGATFCTVHGNDAIMEAACDAASDAAGNDLGILAVTVLTSLDQGDMADLGFQADIRQVVLSRAKRALQIGCAGVVSSGLEVTALRDHVGDKLIAVVPGIRPGLNKPADDQKRTVDVEEAFEMGADYIVVGRPIRNADNPAAAAADVQRRIAAHFA